MFRPLVSSLTRRLSSQYPSLISTRGSSYPVASLSTNATARSGATDDEEKQLTGSCSRQDMPFLHFQPTKRPRPNFKIPRKRASKLFHQINTEAVQDNVERNHAVLKVPFRVGDAIEVTQVAAGGVNSTDLETVRGVVLGIHKRGLGTAFYLRDMLLGEPMERKIPLHSPMLKSIKVLQSNFVKGKQGKKIKRAKLYYLRARNPAECRVTREK